MLLTVFEENLRYSPRRLTEVWPRRFPTLRDAEPYAYNPKALANYVYGERLGNEQEGDGWRFRGRGLIQVTGRDNYTEVQRITGVPCADDPDVLLEPGASLVVALAWWERNVPDSAVGDRFRVRRAVNNPRARLPSQVLGLRHTQRLSDIVSAELGL